MGSKPRPRPHERLKQALTEGRITPAAVAELLQIEPQDAGVAM